MVVPRKIVEEYENEYSSVRLFGCENCMVRVTLRFIRYWLMLKPMIELS